MNQEIGDIVADIVKKRQLERKHAIKRTSVVPNEVERIQRYRAMLDKKREELWQIGVQPVVDKVRNLTEDELHQFNENTSADWQVNPHFVNSSGSRDDEESSKLHLTRHDPESTCRSTLNFIQRYTGKEFASAEEAQTFMLEDAKLRSRPHHKSPEQIANINSLYEITDGLKWSGVVQKQIGE